MVTNILHWYVITISIYVCCDLSPYRPLPNPTSISTLMVFRYYLILSLYPCHTWQVVVTLQSKLGLNTATNIKSRTITEHANFSPYIIHQDTTAISQSSKANITTMMSKFAIGHTSSVSRFMDPNLIVDFPNNQKEKELKDNPDCHALVGLVLYAFHET